MNIDEKCKEFTERLQRIELICQQLEDRVNNLEKGEFGTGIYLEGCSEEAKEYIGVNMKAGE
jgi:hypothetical protein